MRACSYVGISLVGGPTRLGTEITTSPAQAGQVVPNNRHSVPNAKPWSVLPGMSARNSGNAMAIRAANVRFRASLSLRQQYRRQRDLEKACPRQHSVTAGGYDGEGPPEPSSSAQRASAQSAMA